MIQKHETLILTHSDCDGICAGALALAKFPGARVFFTKPVSFLRDLRDVAAPSHAETIVICDIALTKQDAAEAVDLMSRMKQRILYFDHHEVPGTTGMADVKSAVDIYALDIKASASEIIYRHFQKSLPKEAVWLALYGSIGDYTEGTEFARERLRSWDKRALYFEVSTLVLGIKEEQFSSYDAKRRIVLALASGKNPSDISGLVQSAKSAVTREFEMYEQIKKQARSAGSIGYIKDLRHFGFRGSAALFAATVTNRPIGLCIHTMKDHIDITARAVSENPKLRLNKIMEAAAEAVGGSGGGHPQAAGARIPAGMLERFLEEVNRIA